MQNQHSNLTEALLGAGEVMLGRVDGLKRIDLSSAGFWASFWGLGLTALIDTSVYSMLYSTEKFAGAGSTPTKLWYITGNLCISYLGYAASLMMLFLLCRQPSEQARFPWVVIVNNWASPLVSLATLPVMVLLLSDAGSSGGPDFRNFVSVMFFVTIIYLSTNIIRITLNIGALRAFGYLVATAIISIICTDGLKQMFGLSTL